MSVDYQLVCMDCMESISLGKAVSSKYRKQEEKSYAFDNIGLGGGMYDDAEYWKPFVDGCEVMSHFLMLHRTHELRVLPDNVPDVISLRFPVCDEGDDYNYTEFLNRPVRRPEPDEDAKAVSPDVIHRIQEALT